MHQPAKVMETKVFATVPKELYWTGPDTDWLAHRPWGRPGAFLESPNFDLKGEFVYTVDIPYGRIFRTDKSGKFEIFHQYDGEPNSLRFHKDGRIFIADAKRGILILDPVSKKMDIFCNRVGMEGLFGPNDLTFAPNGDLFFTDMGQSDLVRPIGRVIHVRPDGTAKSIIEGVPGPNGLVLNHDASLLYLAVTRTNTIWHLNIRPDGSVSKSGVYLQLSGGLGPDGMTMDSKGNLLVAHAGGACVWVFDPIGDPLYRLKSAVGKVPTNLTFSVDDPHLLYITEATSASILTCRMPDAGIRLYSHS